MRMRLGSAFLAAVLSIAWAAWAPGALAAVAPSGWVYQRGPLPSLSQSRTFLLVGETTKRGCHFDYPDTVLPDGLLAWEVRDVAIDIERCRKLVEEGVPDYAPEAQSGDFATTSMDLGDSSASSTTEQTESLTSPLLPLATTKYGGRTSSASMSIRTRV